MKPRILLFSSLIVIAMSLIWVLGFGFFRFDGGNMEPNLSPGTKVLVAKLLRPNVQDIVAFTRSELNSNEQFLSRLIARSGDKVELRNGVAFVNGENVDAMRELKLIIECSYSDFMKIQRLVSLDIMEAVIGKNAEWVVFFISSGQLNQIPADIPWTFVTQSKNNLESDFPFVRTWQSGWTGLNWGPEEVPPGHYFLLGDSRCNSEDSRFIGFIPESEIHGKVIYP